jgi:hypothetical protein
MAQDFLSVGQSVTKPQKGARVLTYESELVLDSLEGLNGHMKDDQWTALLDSMAQQIATSNATSTDPVTRLLVGRGGGTPPLSFAEALSARPRVACAYRVDSTHQYSVATFKTTIRPVARPQRQEGEAVCGCAC